MTLPTSTYRIQFRNGMTFDRAVDLVPYLKRLGISHLYASPVFTAAPGSTHGYDVADPNKIEPELGGRVGLERLASTLKQSEMGLILDIVPNHMAAALENVWWRSIVEWGKASRYGHFFDVDWKRRLTLPFLGDDFDKVVDAGDISVILDPEQGCLAFAYFETHYPLNPSSYGFALSGIGSTLAREMAEFAATARPKLEEAFHDTMRSFASRADARDIVDMLAQKSRDRAFLRELHDQQTYRLTSWRDAPKDLSYRRFFEITGLAGLRVEDEEVFLESHRTILELVHSGAVDGLRIDHVDGLADPAGYLKRLREAVGPDVNIWIEKILGHGENLPSDWPIQGTTGYEFIASLSELFVDPVKAAELVKAYDASAGRVSDAKAEFRKAKGLMADVNFAGEVSTLLKLAQEMAAGDAATMSLSKEALHRALRELLIAFPVYRTYGTRMGLEPHDHQRLKDVLDETRKSPEPPDEQALMLLARILMGDVDQQFDEKAALFRTRFQQLTGPLMAKSLEDTLFFRLNPLLALNEVGGEPGLRDFSVEAFHREMQTRQERQPHGLSGTSTHDTKRGEDARARLYALSEAPDLWQQSFGRWRDMNRAAVQTLQKGAAPEPEVEWMIYQALVGVWPVDLSIDDPQGLKALEERLLAYTEKALREAKLRTAWTDGDEDYEKAVKAYVSHLLDPANATFLQDFTASMQPVFQAGAVNSLTQTLIKLTAPGIPDIYQGSEGFDLSLVDPDNRREPDFDTLIADLFGEAVVEAEFWKSARLKQAMIAAVLSLRQDLPALFAKGNYVPLQAIGPKADHIVAFAREWDGKRLVVIGARMVLDTIEKTGLPVPKDFWNETVLPLSAIGPRHFRNVISDEQYGKESDLVLSALFAEWPFAVLVSE
ncbi:malto-oligosyltrehalose synthase [Rhizobium oryzicola]|uniref:Malto-oligosyltrehalose synthase n=1 Tax=Rhizobium oryzicola TaxID=1232668 RepID=A0ABT8SVN3_9HYPH|nr:malto-oligosyltrehalose synthase [Rhizobium oryzicola]MDO1582096.1 malto-oligosyltrehalose synthase [Rhizobium oryzicola]